MGTTTAESRRVQARLSVSTRHRGRNHPETVALRRDLAALRIAEDIGRRLATEIILTDAQVAELSSLLRGGAR